MNCHDEERNVEEMMTSEAEVLVRTYTPCTLGEIDNIPNLYL